MFSKNSTESDGDVSAVPRCDVMTDRITLTSIHNALPPGYPVARLRRWRRWSFLFDGSRQGSSLSQLAGWMDVRRVLGRCN